MVCGFHFGALNLDLIPFHWEIMSEYPIVLSCIIIFVIFGMCPFVFAKTQAKTLQSIFTRAKKGLTSFNCTCCSCQSME